MAASIATMIELSTSSYKLFQQDTASFIQNLKAMKGIKDEIKGNLKIEISKINE